jgi:hypothetical protein
MNQQAEISSSRLMYGGTPRKANILQQFEMTTV